VSVQYFGPMYGTHRLMESTFSLPLFLCHFFRCLTNIFFSLARLTNPFKHNPSEKWIKGPNLGEVRMIHVALWYSCHHRQHGANGARWCNDPCLFLSCLILFDLVLGYVHTMMCTYNAGSNAFTVFVDLQGPLPSRAIDLPRRQKRQARARSKWAYDSHGRCLPKKMLGNDTHGPVIEICLNKLRQALLGCCSFFRSFLFFLLFLLCDSSFYSHSPQRKMTFPKTCRLTFAPS
jgi:hypothetical protein